jgi:hypothetical protein
MRNLITWNLVTLDGSFEGEKNGTYRLGIAPVIHLRGRLLFSDGLTPQGL